MTHTKPPRILMALMIAISCATAQENRATSPTTVPLPPGMAHADNPEQVAALYSEANKKRVEAIQEQAPKNERLTPQEKYHLELIAYRTQLVQQQREHKLDQQRREREREARIRADERAAELERQKRREAIYIQHHGIHAYQRSLNDQYHYEQRLLKAFESRHHHQACPQPSPVPPTKGGCDSHSFSTASTLP